MRHGAAISAVALALGVCTAARAQENPEPAADQFPSALEEIVVTAQKREQNLQQVPISVSAVSADSLTANRIASVRDLNAVVPNLVVRTQVGGSGLPLYTMRGVVGLGGVIGSDKGVSLYIDGVYLGAAYGSIIELADIQRIEVLRGPQGTLFGRNSTGGAVNFITPEPSGEFGVKQTVSAGNYDQFRSVTTVSTPQFGAFSARVTYTHNERRGDIRNLGAGTRWDFTPANNGKPKVFTSPKYLGSFNNEAVIGAMKFDPGGAFDALFRFDYAESDFTTSGLGLTYASPAILAAIAEQPDQALMTPITRKRPKALNNSDTVPGHTQAWGGSLTLRYRFSDKVSFKNLLAYRKTTFSSPFADTTAAGGLINTGGPAFTGILGPVLGTSTVGAPFIVRSGSNGGVDKQWSNEFQLNVDTDFVTLTAGLLYFDQSTSRAPFGEEAGLGRARSTSNAVYPGYLVPFAGQPIGTQGRETTIKIRSSAAYAQGEFHLATGLDLIGGIRYTYDKKSGLDYGLFSGADPRVLALNYKKGTTTFSLGANYDISSQVHLYGKYSTGFISGGATAGISFDPETAKSWEAGLKADWFGRKLRTNLSVFTVKYGNLQIPISGRFLVPPQPVITSAIQNAGDARAKGFELETILAPVHGLTLTSGVGYTDFKYLSLLPGVLAGNQDFLIQYRPKWTVNVAAQYESEPIVGDAHLNARIEANWKSSQTGLAGVTSTLTGAQLAEYKAGAVIDSYWLVNGRLALEGFQIGGGKASVALWAKNLLNDKSMSYAISFLSVISADYERARTFGVDLTVEF